MIGQLLSFFLGILASLIAWFVVTNLIKPKMKISSEIEKGKAFVENNKYIYRIKVFNKNYFYKVFDVGLTGRVMIKGLDSKNPENIKSFLIKVGNGSTPYIKPYKKCSDNIKQLVIKTPYSKKSEKGQLKSLYCRYHNINNIDDFGIEEVFDIDSSLKIELEVTVTCTHNFSGARSIFVQKYTKESLVTISKEIFDVNEEVKIE